MSEPQQHHYALSPDIICFGLWSSGTLTTGGDLPPCVGVKCSSYPMCLRERLKSIRDIEKTERGEEIPDEENEDD